MYTQITFFTDSKKCRTAIIIFAVITAALLIAAGVFAIRDANTQSKYTRVYAVVVDNYHGGGSTWTEYEYTMDDETYTTKLPNSYYSLGARRVLLCNADNPNDILIADSMGIMPKIMLGLAGFFGIFTLIYTINLLIIKRRDKKHINRY